MRKLMHDLGIAARGRQMIRVVETLRGEGKLVSSIASVRSMKCGKVLPAWTVINPEASS